MVEEAVLKQFEAINERGGVLGAMETYYQRTRIQDESLEYEHRKYTGEYPIIGVNTYLNPNTLSGEYVRQEIDLTRATPEEKISQIINLREFQKRNADRAEAALKSLKNVAQCGKNIFEELMTTVRYASLGQITGVLYEVGGKYRRSM
jgi:methylmalonyl-CoA mutase